MAAKYVTQAGAGDNSGDSWATAYAMSAITWTKGNTYYFGDTITGTITVGAAPANEGERITLRGDDPDHPCLLNASSGQSLTGTDKNYITVAGFNVIGVSGSAVIYDNKGSYWIIEDNVVVGGSVCVYVRHGPGTIVRRNTVSGTDTSGIGIFLSAVGTLGTHVAGYQCYDNTCFNNLNDGIRLFSDGTTWLVTGASVHDNECYGNGLGGGSSGAGVYAIGCTQSKIYNNYCHDNVGGTESYGIALQSCDACDVFGNRCHDNDIDGIEVWGDDAAGYRRANNVTLRGNIISGVQDNKFGIDCHNIGSGALICGNIVYDCGYTAIMVGSSEGGAGTIANNTLIVDTGKRCVRLEASSSSWDIKNNIFRGGSALLDEGADGAAITMLNNAYDPTVTNQVVDLGGAGGDYTISTIATLDTAAVVTDPLQQSRC